MKNLKAILGLVEIAGLVVTIVNFWGTSLQWLATVWIVYIALLVCIAMYELGKKSRGQLGGEE